MEDTLIQLGPYILPFPIALSAVLSILYSAFNKPDGTSYIPDKFKNVLALVLGMGFGVYTMCQKGIDITWTNYVGWAIFGFLEGAAAVGLYKSVKIISGK